jgi:hypothetical protein
VSMATSTPRRVPRSGAGRTRDDSSGRRPPTSRQSRGRASHASVASSSLVPCGGENLRRRSSDWATRTWGRTSRASSHGSRRNTATARCRAARCGAPRGRAAIGGLNTSNSRCRSARVRGGGLDWLLQRIPQAGQGVAAGLRSHLRASVSPRSGSSIGVKCTD